MAQPKVVLLGDPGAPKKAEAPITVFYSTRPEVPFEEVAKIDVGDTDDNWCMTKIKEEARKVGADAVIVLGRVGSYGVASGSAYGNGSYATGSGMGVSSGYGMSAVAIRYVQGQ